MSTAFSCDRFTKQSALKCVKQSVKFSNVKIKVKSNLQLLVANLGTLQESVQNFSIFYLSILVFKNNSIFLNNVTG